MFKCVNIGIVSHTQENWICNKSSDFGEAIELLSALKIGFMSCSYTIWIFELDSKYVVVSLFSKRIDDVSKLQILGTFMLSSF